MLPGGGSLRRDLAMARSLRGEGAAAAVLGPRALCPPGGALAAGVGGGGEEGDDLVSWATWVHISSPTPPHAPVLPSDPGAWPSPGRRSANPGLRLLLWSLASSFSL